TGGSGDDEYRVDISALADGDTVTVTTNGGDDVVVVLGAGSSIETADFEHIDLIGDADYEFDTDEITSIEVNVDGIDVTLKADTIDVSGGYLYTRGATG